MRSLGFDFIVLVAGGLHVCCATNGMTMRWQLPSV